MSNTMSVDEEVELEADIQQLAHCHGATPVWRGNEVALQRKHYSREGIRQVRQCPEHQHFRNFRDWLGARTSQVREWVC